VKNTWRFGKNEHRYIDEVFEAGEGSATSGSMNNRLEKVFAEKVGAQYGVSFNSGTSTLHAALHAADVGYGDEVIIPALTVYANLAVVIAQNAIPIFADVDPDTFNIDPDDIARKVTPRTKAIVPVPLYGMPCDYDAIRAISDEHGLAVINDAAQAYLAEYRGQPIASLFPITSFSLDATKHITTGDGGMIVTTDLTLAQRIRKFGSLGYKALSGNDGRIRINKELFQDPAYSRHDELGLNYRMSEFAAAVGVAQAERMEHFVNLRRAIAALFADAVEGCEYLIPQKQPEGCTSAYWTYTVRFVRDDDVSWYDFRKKYMEYGGDGIYAAWKLLYQETVFESGAWRRHCPPLYDDYTFERCPNAEMIQPQLMQFVGNYESREEAEPRVEALRKTIEYFG
jgi:perosamine synthetase